MSIFFLASFLLLRVVNIHELSHVFSDNDAQQCEQCMIIAHSHQIAPLGLGPLQTDFSFQDPFEWEPINGFELYTAPNQKILHSDYFYNKPPPNYILG